MKLVSRFVAIAGAATLLTAVWAFAAGSALAAATQWIAGEHVQARLVAASEGVGADGLVRLGLQLRLDEGWETYWRSPGDAGIPPQFDWSASQNLGAISVAWPLPRRFTALGMTTIGYENEIILPVTAAVPNPDQATKIRLHAAYAVCREVCYLVEQDFALDIPAGAAPDNASLAALIERFQARVPSQNAPDFAVESVAASVGTNASIEILARSTTPMRAPDVIIEAPAGFSFNPPTVRLLAGGRRAIFRSTYAAGTGAAEPLPGQTVTVTVFDGDRAVQKSLPVLAAD